MTTIAPVTGPDFVLVHPLIDAKKRFGVKALARHLGHANHSTMSVYLRRAVADPDTRTPAEWVLPLCRLTRRKPADYRPDLYLPEWDLPMGG